MITATKVYGPYVRKDGRSHVIVMYSDGSRRTVSYPKYLKELELGRILDPDRECVHHKDEDFTNDELENLEIKDRPTHTRHHNPGYGEIELVCDGCNKPFKLDSKRLSKRYRKGRTKVYCSRVCSGRANNQYT